MKSNFFLIAWAFTFCSGKAQNLPAVELVPEDRLGARGLIFAEEVQWNCEHEDLGKAVEVCRRIPKKFDLKPIIELAEEYGMKQEFDWHETTSGVPGDGTIVFRGEKGRVSFVFYNPNWDHCRIGLRRSMDFKRDADWLPILEGQPSRERAVEICREWMKKLKIDEAELAKYPQGMGGFDVQIADQAVYTHRDDVKGGLKKLSFVYGTSLIFPQRIGRYNAYYNGEGGTLQFELADGGKMASIWHTMHAWEPMGEYELLSKEEISTAIKERFCWTEAPIAAKAIRIDGVFIEAQHSLPEVPQKHFPLVYRLMVRGADESKEAPYDMITMPALKQHRNKYGPAPKGDKERVRSFRSDIDPPMEAVEPRSTVK